MTASSTTGINTTGAIMNADRSAVADPFPAKPPTPDERRKRPVWASSTAGATRPAPANERRRRPSFLAPETAR